MVNAEDDTYFSKAESSFQKPEIETRLQVARQLARQYPESAILYAWSLVEATLRLVVEHEGISLQRFDPLYLVKQLVAEGAISRSEYQLLMNALSSRNAIAHGFKTTQLTQESVYELVNLVYELVNLTEQLLEALYSSSKAD